MLSRSRIIACACASVAAILFACFTPAASAQFFNVDLDLAGGSPALGGGVPGSSYGAAANQPGVWNSYPTTTGPVPLVDLSGNATGVSLGIPASSTTVTTLGFNNPNNSGDFALLINDGQQVGTVVQGGSRTYEFSGIANGAYSVWTYATPPQPGNLGNNNIDVIGSNEGILSTNGAHLPNTFTPGITHVVHTLNVTNNTITIRMTDIPGSPAAYASAFQITAIPEPAGVGSLCLAAFLLARFRRNGHIRIMPT
jgi:hypothetical protein